MPPLDFRLSEGWGRYPGQKRKGCGSEKTLGHKDNSLSLIGSAADCRAMWQIVTANKSPCCHVTLIYFSCVTTLRPPPKEA
jgi:hypothetical protein